MRRGAQRCYTLSLVGDDADNDDDGDGDADGDEVFVGVSISAAATDASLFPSSSRCRRTCSSIRCNSLSSSNASNANYGIHTSHTHDKGAGAAVVNVYA